MKKTSEQVNCEANIMRIRRAQEANGLAIHSLCTCYGQVTGRLLEADLRYLRPDEEIMLSAWRRCGRDDYLRHPTEQAQVGTSDATTPAGMRCAHAYLSGMRGALIQAEDEANATLAHLGSHTGGCQTKLSTGGNPCTKVGCSPTPPAHDKTEAELWSPTGGGSAHRESRNRTPGKK